MKISAASVLVLLYATGCHTQPQAPKISADQAMATAVQLANDKCDALYQKRPFQLVHLARFIDGRWVWRDIRGVGQLDLEAQVELAADGSTNRVDIKLLDSRQVMRVTF